MPLPFDPTRVAVVDDAPERNATLVRGMDPASTGIFDAKSLLDAFTSKGVQVNGRNLVVVNVIDNTGERWAWGPEMVTFGADTSSYPASQWPPYLNRPGWTPGKPVGDGKWVVGNVVGGRGDLYWWPFEGLPAGEDPKVFLTSPGWDFSGVVDLVVQLFQQPKVVVYFHCMLGADRTGALHTGYLMRAKGMTLAAASKVADTATSAHGPNEDYQRLRAAYAATLTR